MKTYIADSPPGLYGDFISKRWQLQPVLPTPSYPCRKLPTAIGTYQPLPKHLLVFVSGPTTSHW